MKYWVQWADRRRVLRASVATAGCLMLLAFFSSWIVGSLLLAPAHAPVALPASFQNTEVSFQSDSGARLRGNFLAGKPGGGVVVLLHGVRSNRGAMEERAQLLNSRGFSILLFDFQAHGESSGERITNGYLESRDAAAAVRFVRERAPRERIGMVGVSLGGAAAVLAEPRLDVDAMVLELVYADIARAVKNRAAIVAGSWVRPFSPLLTWQLKARIGVAADWFSPERAVAKIPCPKLIIGGMEDRHTTSADTEALFASAQEPKELWMVPNARHEDLHRVAPSEYEARVISFLESALKK